MSNTCTTIHSFCSLDYNHWPWSISQEATSVQFRRENPILARIEIYFSSILKLYAENATGTRRMSLLKLHEEKLMLVRLYSWISTIYAHNYISLYSKLVLGAHFEKKNCM